MLLSRRAQLLLVALQAYRICAVYASTINASEANTTCPAPKHEGRLVQESLEICWENEAPSEYTSTSSSQSVNVAYTQTLVPSAGPSEPVQTSSTTIQLAAISTHITADASTLSIPISTPTSISTPSSTSTSTRQEPTVLSEIQTIGLASSSEPAKTLSASSVEETPSVPDFPSFEEWKRKHLASAAAHKDGKKGSNHTNHTTKGQDVEKPANTEEKEEKPGKKWSLQKAKDSILGHQAKQAPIAVIEADAEMKMHPLDGEALSPATQKILHPVPHAGSGDLSLDPLISLRDRTNYASVDCSATLMRASKNIKSASSILSSKKDRYMLTPCSVKEKFVIVELCEEIQIDTIVLANLEFFSSMFKMFRITAGTSYPESTGTWQEIGTFRASNVRGMQVFRPQEPSRGGFYRYIRVDFLTHYGTEYYCPVSLLKVYGLTNLDAYRRDQEREKLLAEASEDDLLQIIEQPEIERLEDETVYLQLVDASTAPMSVNAQSMSKVAELEATRQDLPPAHTISEILESLETSVSTPMSTSSKASQNGVSALPEYTDQSLSSTPVSGSTPGSAFTASSSWLSASIVRTALATSPPSDASARKDPPTIALATSVPPSKDLYKESSMRSAISSHSRNDLGGSDFTVARPSSSDNDIRTPYLTNSEQSPDPVSAVSTPASSTDGSSWSSQSKVSASVTSVDLRTKSEGSVIPTTTGVAASLKPVSSKSLPPLTYKTVATASMQPPAQNRRNDTRTTQPQVIYTHPSQPQPNESIYGTIMKRLLALEVNSTLSTGYIEEHTRFVWESFRRIEEKLSGIEHSRGQQDQLLRRIILDLDLHRARLEAERIELNAQINILSKEMVLEKRLGLVQMAGLVMLLLFVLLTRGSPSTPFLTIPQSRATGTPVFPPRVPRHRPRSLIHQSIDGLPGPMSAREPTFRERRSAGPERRNGTASNAVSRTTSIKRSSRPSNNIRRPPQPPMTAHARSHSEAITSPVVSASAPLSAPLLTLAESASHSLHDAPSSGQDPFSPTDGSMTPTSSALALEQVSPTGRSVRLGPVDSIKRKFRLLQASKSAETTHLSPPSPSNLEGTTLNGDKRRFFKLGRRRSTVGSADTEGGKAWQSMSDGSGEEDNIRTIRHSTTSGDMVFMPSPDPSDAEPTEFRQSSP